jgi:glycosyltransferase involved in cell wall biosynthesis
MMKNKIRLFVVSFTGDSGLTDYSVSLCRELDKLCDVTFLTATSYNEAKYKLAFKTIKLFRRTRHYPIDILKFIYTVLQQKPDIVLFQSWLKYPLVEIALLHLFKIAGIRVALTIHDLLPHYPKIWSRLSLTWYYRSFDKLIVHSQRAAEGLAAMGVTLKPLKVPHGLYDIFDFDKLTRAAVLPMFPDVKQDDFVVLFFGHLETRKGIVEFLEASELLIQEPSIKFLVAGKSSLQGMSSEYLEACRTKTNVIIHDYMIPITEVQRYFTLADLIVLPYLEGTTSGILKLAMAFKKPMLATDVGDFRETLADWSGTLIDLHDIPKNISMGILETKANYAQYLASVHKNNTKYQWDTIATHYLNYLNCFQKPMLSPLQS